MTTLAWVVLIYGLFNVLLLGYFVRSAYLRHRERQRRIAWARTYGVRERVGSRAHDSRR